jgi:hypothetical protein
MNIIMLDRNYQPQKKGEGRGGGGLSQLKYLVHKKCDPYVPPK